MGGFGDTAFFHKKTKTLLVTDAVIRVDDDAPAIIQEDPRSLLYHSRDSMTEIVDDTLLNRQKGWRRMVLFGLTFNPAGDIFLNLTMMGKVSSISLLLHCTGPSKKKSITLFSIFYLNRCEKWQNLFF